MNDEAFNEIKDLVVQEYPALSDVEWQVCLDADGEHRKSSRQYMHVLHMPGVICCARAVADLPKKNALGLFAHEFGHLLLDAQGKRQTEPGADRAWLDMTGVAITYSRKKKGWKKGLQQIETLKQNPDDPEPDDPEYDLVTQVFPDAEQAWLHDRIDFDIPAGSPLPLPVDMGVEFDQRLSGWHGIYVGDAEEWLPVAVEQGWPNAQAIYQVGDPGEVPLFLIDDPRGGKAWEFAGDELYQKIMFAPVSHLPPSMYRKVRRVDQAVEQNPAGNLPKEAMAFAKRLLRETRGKSNLLCGTSRVVAGWWVESHTLGCRNAADEPEEEWLSSHWAIFDEYTGDGMSVVLGSPDDGDPFVTLTPQRSVVEGYEQNPLAQPDNPAPRALRLPNDSPVPFYGWKKPRSLKKDALVQKARDLFFCLFPNVEPYAACLYLGLCMCAVSRRWGTDEMLLQAGTTLWPLKDPWQTGSSGDTHFGYSWTSDNMKQALVHRKLPEMHVWNELAETGEIIDINLGFWPEQAERHNYDWIGTLPPDYMWTERIPERVVYEPDSTAISVIQELVETGTSFDPLKAWLAGDERCVM